MKVFKLEIWYTEDRKFVLNFDVKSLNYESDVINQWNSLPTDGVLFIMLHFDEGSYRRAMSGSDYYFVSNGDNGLIFAQSSQKDTKEEVLERYPNALIKLGKWTDDYTIYKIQREAMKR